MDMHGTSNRPADLLTRVTCGSAETGPAPLKLSSTASSAASPQPLFVLSLFQQTHKPKDTAIRIFLVRDIPLPYLSAGNAFICQISTTANERINDVVAARRRTVSVFLFLRFSYIPMALAYLSPGIAAHTCVAGVIPEYRTSLPVS
jgi:hypothetical protein